MNHRTETPVHFDPPSLFVRADRFPETRETPRPAPVEIPADTLFDAFHGYAQVRLAEASRTPTGTRFSTPATIAHAHLRNRGFTPDEVRQLGFGLYTTPQDVHDHLRQMGFSEAAIRESGLVFDGDGRPRNDWTGNVIVPVDEAGDLYVFDPQNPADARFLSGPNGRDVAAYGLREARAAVPANGRLLLVEDVVDAMYLRRRGLPETAATGCPPAEFTPQRWRALVREGIDSVTLAFSRNASRDQRIRDALSHALVARTAPQVYVLESGVLEREDSAAEFVHRNGEAPLRAALRTAIHAFDGKDYTRRTHFETPRPRYVPEPAPRAEWTTDWTETRRRREVDAVRRFRSFLVAEIDKIVRPSERAAWHAFLVDVETAMNRGEFDRARNLVQSWYARIRPSKATAPTTLGGVVRSLRDDRRADLVDFADVPTRSTKPGCRVETIAVGTASGRLAMVCDRLVEAIESDPEGRHVVVCREFTARTIAFGLISRMANDLTDGPGLDAAQIWDRLAGREERRGYDDRPWLVDEAIDCLRRSFDHVEFVDGQDSRETVAELVARRFDDRAITSVIDAAGEWVHEWAPTRVEAMHGLDCPVTIVIDAITPTTPVEYRYEPDWSNWWPASHVPTASTDVTHRGFHDVLREWIAYAETTRSTSRFA